MHASVNVILVVVCFVFGNRPATGVPVARNESTTIDSISDTEAAWEETTTTTTPTSSPSPTSVDSADKEVARKKGHDKRVITLSAAHEEPVTNEVSEKAFEDLEFLCHHFYKDEFVVSAHVTEAGCQLECVLLKSSGAHGSSFFDTSVRKQHNINEGQTCDSENPAFKCLNGSCIEPPETGKAVISIINGTFESSSDEGREPDSYVKVFLDQKYLMKTKTVESSYHPAFAHAFVTPVITSDTQIGFVVFAREDSEDRLLLTVQTTVDLILALRLNGTVTCQPEGSPRGRLCFSVKWFQEVG